GQRGFYILNKKRGISYCSILCCQASREKHFWGLQEQCQMYRWLLYLQKKNQIQRCNFSMLVQMIILQSPSIMKKFWHGLWCNYVVTNVLMMVRNELLKTLY